MFATVTSLVPNATFFAELALFAAVVWLVGRFVVPQLRSAMHRRQAEIDHARHTAEADTAAAREMLAQARAEAEEILAEARSEGHRIRAVSREVADGILAEAQRRAEAGRHPGPPGGAPAVKVPAVSGTGLGTTGASR